MPSEFRDLKIENKISKTVFQNAALKRQLFIINTLFPCFDALKQF